MMTTPMRMTTTMTRAKTHTLGSVCKISPLWRKNIYQTLSAYDPDNRAYFKKNHRAFLQELQATDDHIKGLLKGVKKGTGFFVYHPSWGYFAHAYDLKQHAIEVEGKSPKPKMLKKIIDKAKAENIRAIITNTKMWDKSPKIVAKSLGVPLVKVNHLSPDYKNTLISIARSIAHQK